MPSFPLRCRSINSSSSLLPIPLLTTTLHSSQKPTTCPSLLPSIPYPHGYYISITIEYTERTQGEDEEEEGGRKESQPPSFYNHCGAVGGKQTTPFIANRLDKTPSDPPPPPSLSHPLVVEG